MRQLSAKLELPSPQVFYDLKSGKLQGVSRNVLELLKKNLPEVSAAWILTGEGAMLAAPASGNTQVIGKNNGTAINGGGSVQAPAGADAQFREYAMRKDAQVDELLSQNGRLIRIIERLTEKGK
ncbi:MAG: hypothetical protein II841_11460 [Bacteroidales bacterium]|nr:hypothetical protein [Bacteroidales bacterium]